MERTLTKSGDKIYGTRIYVEFRDWAPKTGPKEIRKYVSEFTLKKTVRCWIVKPIKSKMA